MARSSTRAGSPSGSRPDTEASHWRAFGALVSPHRGAVILMGVVLAIAGVLPLIGPLLVAWFVDAAVAGRSATVLSWVAGLYVAVGVMRQIMAVAVARFATDLAWRVTNDLRGELTEHVLALDLGFHRATSPGELVARVDGDVTALSDFIVGFMVKALAAVVTLVGIVVVLLVQDWRVGLGLAVYLAIAVATVFRLRDHAADESASEQAANGRMLGEIEERLAGADDLRSNGGGSHALVTFQHASRRVLQATLRNERQVLALWIISNVVFVAGGIAAIAIDAVLLRQGAITLGTAYLIFQYTQVMREPLGRLADETERAQRAIGGMRRTIQLLGERPDVVDTASGEVLPPGALELALVDVTFAYADEDNPQPVLDGVDLTLGAARTLGVIGRTGSGKTTLARLILRLVDPTTGHLGLGGVPLTEVSFDELRRRTGVVTQDVHLFGASLRDNLTLFDPSIDDQAVRAALAELGLLDWVDGLPEGLDTVLGPEGDGLSAGEAQLVSLTRLFLRSPDLVLLDEASSRIDPATERRVTRAIDRLVQGRTAIVIAHRLSTIARLDEVVVLDAGRVVEHGPTGELGADPSSRYAAMLAVGADVIDELEQV